MDDPNAQGQTPQPTGDTTQAEPEQPISVPEPAGEPTTGPANPQDGGQGQGGTGTAA